MPSFLIRSPKAAPELSLIHSIGQLLGIENTIEYGNVVKWRTRPEPSQSLRTDLKALCNRYQTDSVWLADYERWEDYGLLVMDMDSTLISIECIDEIADYCGKKKEVSAITEAAMRGEISDYDTSLRQRVALLAGVSAEALGAVYSERLKYSPGARQLVQQAKSKGLKTLLVSGGFTYFTDRVKTELGIDYVHSNQLEIVAGRLTGAVVGDIVNAAAKAQWLKHYCAELGIPPQQAIAVGDGANDMKMMAVAGLSVAYHAKPAVTQYARAAIQFGGLDTLSDWLEET